LLPLLYGGKEAWAPYGGNQCQEQTRFSSKPTESPYRSRNLIKHRSFTLGSTILLNVGSAERPSILMLAVFSF